jgi:putative aldouronate transport system substrate-binding protein
MGDIQTFVSESVLAFINGTKSFDEYDAFIQQVKDMGVEEAVQIKQAALDRYNARIK